MTEEKNKNNINYQSTMLVGTDDFCDLIVNSDIFVDKSLLIKELLEDKGKVILITRPRRWGKSLNMDMVRRFFEIEVDDHGQPLAQEQRVNYKLFAGGEVDLGFDETKLLKPLKIASVANSMKRQGQFPVIFITFKSAEGTTYHDIEAGVKEQIHQLFQLHRYLSDSSKLNQDEKADFDIYLSPAKALTIENIKSSLSLLSKLLYKHYNRKPWILIDEYDTPINSAYRYFGDNELEFQNVLKIFRGIMKSVFKKGTRDLELPVERGVVTGILRIAKAELFSGLNNLTEYSLLDENFASSYGFTQEEVDELLTKVLTTTDPEEIKNWYNGYNFGGEIIYNPWSIMQCLSRQGVLDHYWIDSGGTQLVDKALLSDEMQEDLRNLVTSKTITLPIMKQISFADINKPVGLFSLLLFSGYLNPTAKNPEKNIYELSVPNEEIKYIYEARMLRWLADQLETDDSRYYSLINLLPSGKIEEFASRLQELLQNATSFHQVGEKKAELFYSGFMLGLINTLTTDYVIDSERESGNGRPDIVMIPKSSKGDKAMIIEYKIAKSSENLGSIAKSGLQQIIDRKYDSKIKELPHVKQILKISMAFSGKNMELQYEITKL
jgi:hypothetical protein